MTKQMKHKKRAEMLNKWYGVKTSAEKEAAVMIMGYEMYRNLLKGCYTDYNVRETFLRTLRDPGKEIIYIFPICI